MSMSTILDSRVAKPAGGVRQNVTRKDVRGGRKVVRERTSLEDMRTMDDGIQAMCGAAELGYFEDKYIKNFVRRQLKQNPHCHIYQYLKATWLRGTVQKWGVSKDAGQVLHFGAGFDTCCLCTSREGLTCYDIDEPDVMERKRNLLAPLGELPPGYNLLGSPIDNYTNITDNKAIDKNISTLFILDGILSRSHAEGNKLLQWVASFRDPHIIGWDEVCPKDTYGQLMCAAKGKSGRPLKHIDKYPSLESIANRLSHCGVDVPVSTAYHVLDTFTSNVNERTRIQKIEPFTDWEDVIEAVTHTATFSTLSPLEAAPSQPPASPPSSRLHFFRKLKEFYVGVGHSIVMHPSGDFAIIYQDSELLLINLLHIHLQAKPKRGHPAQSGAIPEGRHFHQAAMIDKSTMMLFGGCTSKGTPCDNKVYHLDTSTLEWSVHEVTTALPLVRWRHSMVTTQEGSVLLFGGTNAGLVLGDSWCYTSEEGWTKLDLTVTPPARHSASLTVTSSGDCVLHGGMGADFQLLNDTWVFDSKAAEWREITFQGWVPDARMSHGAAVGRDGVLILGGSTAQERCGGVGDSEAYLIMIDGTRGICKPLYVEVGVAEGGGGNSMLLVRHSLIQFQPNTYLALGGGSHCLSYGTFLNQARIAVLDISSAAGKAFTASTRMSNTVPRLDSVTEAQWKMLIYPKRQPVVMRADFGSCVEKWNFDYLQSVMGEKETSVGISESPRLTFHPRNYKFEVMPFEKLLRNTVCNENKEEYMYFRSVGKNMRKDVADFWDTMPEVAEDFKVPSFLQSVNLYSSALRVASKDVIIWCHYDITDGCLFQISGTKQVLLFPPDEIGNLYIEGSSSLAGDVTSCDYAQYPLIQKALKRSRLVTLKPGDILFIPALWFHSTWAQEASVGLNVSWKHLGEKHYEKNDLYGNKDIVEATAALKAMDKVHALLEQVPEYYRGFYARKMTSDIERRHCTVSPVPVKLEDIEPDDIDDVESNGPLSPGADDRWQTHNLGVFAGTLAEIPVQRTEEDDASDSE